MEAFEFIRNDGICAKLEHGAGTEFLDISGASLVFDLEKTFDCGQCFRWNKSEKESFIGVVQGNVLEASEKSGHINVYNLSGEFTKELCGFLVNYFDLQTDYQKINRKLSEKDEILRNAVNDAVGIRLLNQEFFETLISFLISQNNNIPRIKKCIELLCENYGKEIMEYEGKKYYSFPTWEDLYDKNPTEIQTTARVGYRGDYIVDASKAYSGGIISYEKLMKLDPLIQLETISKVKGVGNKVANCILLFAGIDRSSFPVDVWVERMMNQLYGINETDRKKIEKIGKEYFGELSGIAQQYLFYYIREKN